MQSDSSDGDYHDQSVMSQSSPGTSTYHIGMEHIQYEDLEEICKLGRGAR